METEKNSNDALVQQSYQEAEKLGVTLDSHFDAGTGPNFEGNYNSDLYKKYIKYKTLDEVLRNEQKCQEGKV